jgi:hypothetical protein
VHDRVGDEFADDEHGILGGLLPGLVAAQPGEGAVPRLGDRRDLRRQVKGQVNHVSL